MKKTRRNKKGLLRERKRHTACVNARGIPPVPHSHPIPVHWGGGGRGVSQSCLGGTPICCPGIPLEGTWDQRLVYTPKRTFDQRPGTYLPSSVDGQTPVKTLPSRILRNAGGSNLIFIFSRCTDCVNDIDCGFCFVDVNPLRNGSCVPASVDTTGSIDQSAALFGMCSLHTLIQVLNSHKSSLIGPCYWHQD